MTTAVAVLWPDTGVCSLVLRGHATGSERVCAAVSGIVWMLAGYLANDAAVTVTVSSLEPGDTQIEWTGGGREALAVFQAVCIGLMQIEKSEPERLQTKISKNIFQIGA